MGQIIWEIIIILLLTVLNGFFACSEIALISIRKTRITSLVKQGNRRAAVIKQLQRNPESLFATIQIGISLITILASAFAGSRIAGHLSEVLSRTGFSFIANHSYLISFILIVALISYLNLIIGELVPKSLGLRYAETFALIAAYPIWWLSKISSGLIKFLTLSSNLILKPFKDSTSFTESRLSEEEIRTLIAEGHAAGTIAAHERSMIENIFEFSDLDVGKIMVPRGEIVGCYINQPAEQIVQTAINSGYSRIPIYQGTPNTVIGILYTKRLLPKIGKDIGKINLQDFLVAPYFVPNTMKISEVLQRLQRKKVHMALVTDEYGEIEGLVTLEDILEEIVGDIADETDEASQAVIKQPDGEFLVAGGISIVDFNRQFEADLPEDQDFATLSGFILDKLGRFPKEGDAVESGGLEFLVKEKTPRTVKTLAVKRKGGQ